jgi:hypothetical protein
MALRIYGVTLGDTAEGGGATTLPDGTRSVVFRELAAIVGETESFVLDSDPETQVAAHRAVVDRLFKHTTVLPAPVGTLFRDQQVMLRWLELHYVALTDTLAFVEDRSAARVHITRKDGNPADADSGADLAAAAGEAFRSLRRRAVAAVPLRTEHLTGIVLSGAFLVDNELWKQFTSTVDEAQEEHDDLKFQVTGPWAPYDFVRMQFGG